MRIVFVLIALIFTSSISAQLMVLSLDNPGELSFNEKFIKENRISKIQSEKYVKRRGQAMLPTKEFEFFYFDAEGKQIKREEVKLYNSKVDTTSISFNVLESLYEKVQLSTLKKSKIVLTEQVVYSEGSKRIDIYRRESKILPIGEVPNDQKPINTLVESKQYNWINDSLQVESVYNSLGIKYLEITYCFNPESELLLSESQRYVIGNRKRNIQYEYNEKGYLSKITEDSNSSLFHYNEWNELILIETYNNALRTSRLEYLYNAQGLLEAELTKYEDSPTVYIKKFIISFDFKN